MGTFIGHILPGAGFLLIGLWHVYNILRNYVEAPWNFQTQAWFPTRWSGKRKYLELQLIIFGSCLSIAAELFICPKRHQPFADDWSIPSDHLNNFEHSTIALFFLLFAFTCLCSELLKIHVPRGLLHVMGAFAFGQELLLFHFHSADHMGLEGHYHWLLQLPIAVGVVCALVEIAAPKAFIVSLLRGVAVVFQGSWFIQMGLTLWVPSLVPLGCEMYRDDGHDRVRCGTHEADMRAKALANLAFSWHLAVIIVFTLIAFVGMMFHQSRWQHAPYQALTSFKESSNTNSKDVESATSPKGSVGDGSHSSESDIEMQPCMSSIALER